MGLDMYAYTIKADLIGDQQVDISINAVIDKHFGFVCPTDSEIQELAQKLLANGLPPEVRTGIGPLTSENATSYASHIFYTKRRKNMENAEELGLINTKFAYWRKFYHLHNWMNKLYSAKGGQSETFNCDTVRLMPEDIDKLESDYFQVIFNNKDRYDDEEDDDIDFDAIKKFIIDSREAFEQGKAVVYDSWS